jgi:hypothetical protein
MTRLVHEGIGSTVFRVSVEALLRDARHRAREARKALDSFNRGRGICMVGGPAVEGYEPPKESNYAAGMRRLAETHERAAALYEQALRDAAETST